MPHVIIEHQKSAELDFSLNELAVSLHNHLAEQETVNKWAVTTRTVLSDNVCIGEGDGAKKFVHVTILLLAGRSDELKKTISKSVLDKLQSFIGVDDYALSVDSRDLGAYNRC